MACQLFRENGKVDKVLAPNEKPSNLYQQILEKVKKDGVAKYLSSIPYLRDRIADGTLMDESAEEIAIGIWSIAYSPEYQAYFNKANGVFGTIADENGEPKFSIFEAGVLGQTSSFTRVSTGYVLDADKKKFITSASKQGNDLQKAIVKELIENPNNPVVLEPVSHVYIDQDGEVYTSTTTAIKGKLEDDTYAVNREYGTSIDKMLQGIILGKKFDEIAADIDNIDKPVLKNAFNILQTYIDGLTRDGSIVVTQVALGDKDSKIAGSLDLLVISPQGKVKVIDLKTSKNSVKGESYDVKYDVKEGSKLKGEKLSTRQQHGIQVGVYKKLVELLGFEVTEVQTVHLKLTLDKSKKLTEIDWEGEVRHPLSINQPFVDRVIPTEIDSKNRTSELAKELNMDNPVDDPNYLTEEESKPEKEVYGDMYDRMYAEVKSVINLFDARKKYLEKIRKGKTRVDKDVMIDKITEVMVMMGSELKMESPSLAYGAFVRFATEELNDYLKEIVDPKNFNDPDYISLLLEVDKYVESYRGIINLKGVGSKEQQLKFLELIDILDDTKEAIDDNLQKYVKKVVMENTSRNLTEQELDKIMKEVYDIPTEDYWAGDMSTSKDTLLAIADKIYKAAINRAKDNTETTVSRILEMGTKLLKAAGITKPGKDFYDFMKVMKDGKFTGRYVGRIGSQYYDLYYAAKNKVTEKNGDRKQYIPILDPDSASQDDLNYNISLYYAKQEYRDFMNAEILGPNGAEDGKYHKFTDQFKVIRNRYQELIGYEKEDGSMFYKWQKREEITDEQYEQFRLKYFNQVDYWGAEREADGTFKGRVSLKTGFFVKNEFTETRDVAEDGTDLRDPKYIKLMNPQTALEKAQSEFYQTWTSEYQTKLEKLPPEVAAQMRGKVGRVRASFFNKIKQGGEGFGKAVSKGVRNVFSSEYYTNQRVVDELGQVDQGLPILYVGSLQNQGRIDYLNNELTKLKTLKVEKKISQKEYLETKKKLKEYLKLEENKVKADDIEGDLVNNLIAFASMAENYEVMSNIESDLQAIAKVMEDRTYYQTDSLGKILIRKGSKMTKDDEGKPVVKKPEDVLATKRLKKWFQMVYYNNQEFSKGTMAIIAARVQNLTSLKGVGFNLFGGVNNYAMGRINTAIETAGAIYYDRPAMTRSVGEYNKDYLPNMFTKLGKFTQGKDGGHYGQDKPASKYEALVTKFRVIKKYQSDSGKVDPLGWAYMFQEGGEYNVQSKTGIAILMTKNITNKNTGETLSIYDAFDFDPNTGELKLKDGYELSDKERYDIINYILEVNKQIHGNYSFEDRMVLQEKWLGQLGAQFHKWVYPAYKSRFKKAYFDENLGDIEGRYVSIVSLISHIKEAEGDFFEKMRTGWKNLNPRQIKNMYKNLAEVAFFAASFAMYGLIRAIAEGVDDDDETLKRWLNFLSYQQTRQMVELSTMIPIVGIEEQYQLAKSPIAVLGTLKDFGQALKATMSLPFPPYDENYYQRGTRKGDLKAWKEWKDVLPAFNILNKWEAYDQVKTFYIK